MQLPAEVEARIHQVPPAPERGIDAKLAQVSKPPRPSIDEGIAHAAARDSRELPGRPLTGDDHLVDVSLDGRGGEAVRFPLEGEADVTEERRVPKQSANGRIIFT
jgi:hypothetical protein